jgi:glutathione S-transferase
MNRRTLLVLLLALGALSAVSPAAAEPEPDFIAINPRGVVPVEMDGGRSSSPRTCSH